MSPANETRLARQTSPRADTTLDAVRDDAEREHPSSKRRKPAEERTRASRACDRCKSRKTRCTGKFPCAVCARLRLDCKYTAAYRRGRLPSIEMDEGNGGEEAVSRRGPRATEDQLKGQPGSIIEDMTATSFASEQGTLVPVESSRDAVDDRPPAALEAGRGVSTAQSSRNSPEPGQTDQQGHYVGPASGASFLLRIQRKLQQQPSDTTPDMSIFTFGDLPLPDFDTRFLILPPRSEADGLVTRYFEVASATHRFLHRPTIEQWLKDLYETNGNMRGHVASRSRTALIFMVFAHASNFPDHFSQSGTRILDSTASTRYFAAAEDQLIAEKGAIRLTSVQARLSQCFFLLSHSRINHCWSLFGTTAHLMLALGIHRKLHGDSANTCDPVDAECRKRTFWCAYNLDTYLSTALGRPRTFHDDDIDQEMPLLIDDYLLIIGRSTSQNLSPQSIMTAPVAHFKLSRILANILRDLYGIRPVSTDKQYKLAEKYAKDIESWRAGISYLVDTDVPDASLFRPIFLRQRGVLNMACWHAQILLHRPFLLNNFASLANLSAPRHREASRNATLTESHVNRGLAAALSIVQLVDDLDTRGQLYNTLWFSHYFAFCAVVMLYVYAIQQSQAPPEKYMHVFQAATKCQSQITSVATPGSLAQRYGVVLQELRLELLRHNSHLFNLASAHRHRSSVISDSIEQPGLSMGTGSENNYALDGDDILFNPASASGIENGFPMYNDGTAFVEGSPGSSIAQMTGWGQFDSLVTGGMGKLDSFLGNVNMDGWDIDLGGGIGGG